MNCGAGVGSIVDVVSAVCVGATVAVSEIVGAILGERIWLQAEINKERLVIETSNLFFMG